MGRLLTTKEAGERLGVSASRVRQFILEERLEAVKRGRDLFLEENEVDRFAASRDRDRRKGLK